MPDHTGPRNPVYIRNLAYILELYRVLCKNIQDYVGLYCDSGRENGNLLCSSPCCPVPRDRRLREIQQIGSGLKP